MRIPWKVFKKKPPKQGWLMTFLLGGCVIWLGMLVGLLVSELIK